MKKVGLKNITVSEKVFNQILLHKNKKLKLDSLADYKCGYSEKQICYYTDTELIIQKYEIDYIHGDDLDKTEYWKQYLVTMDKEQSEDIINDNMNPVQATNYLNNIIHKEYTEEEKIDIFNNHQLESSTILHTFPTRLDGIVKYKNCYYYDINGAYASKFIELFPKCKKELLELFEHRHDNHNRLKNVFNYYVGMLTQNEKKRAIKARTIYPNTRHWIVQSITDKVKEFSTLLNGKYNLYVNTDGLIVKEPKNIIANSTQMNEFKLEFSGDVYVYYGKNYFVMQYGNEIKGSLPLELRKYIDLPNGKVVEFDRKLINGVYIPENVKQIKIGDRYEI